MQVRVTPIDKAGKRGKPIVHDNVTDYDHEVVDPDSPDVREVLVLQVGDEEVRYPLDEHWVEIIPDPVVEPEPEGTEVPDDLGRTPNDVRAQFAERQAKADKLRRQIRAHHETDEVAKAEFEKWSEGADYATADLVLLARYWSSLQAND